MFSADVVPMGGSDPPKNGPDPCPESLLAPAPTTGCDDLPQQVTQTMADDASNVRPRRLT